MRQKYDGEQSNATLITGVANNAILIGSRSMEITFSGRWTEKFTFSMWIKVANVTGPVLQLVTRPFEPMAVFSYDAKTQLFRVDFQEWGNHAQCTRYVYHLKPNIFFHTVFVWNKRDLQFYKNGVIHPHVVQGVSPCVGNRTRNVDTLKLFPGSAFDDVAIWLTNLSMKDVSRIFTRYSKSATLYIVTWNKKK